MRPIKSFDEFLKEGVAKKQSPDKSRAKFLVEESTQNYIILLDIVKKMGMTDVDANIFIKLCYDILMEMIRARMLLEGYNATGKGAHEAEVSYLRVIGFGESDVQFIDQLRFFRNGILYYGKIMDKEYGTKVLEFTKKMYPKLKDMINQHF